MRPLRSKWVGASSPTSTPRWTSRHCSAPGKCLRHSRRGPQRRWSAADRDLRDTRGDLAQRDRRRQVNERARCVSPAAERRPLRAPRHARRYADPLANTGRWQHQDRPQRHRHRNRREAVVPPRRDPTGHHQHDRWARHATIPTTPDPRPLWIRISPGRAKDRAVAEPVTMQAQATARRSARTSAPRALSWTCCLGRRRPRDPPLDVERAVNDE